MADQQNDDGTAGGDQERLPKVSAGATLDQIAKRAEELVQAEQSATDIAKEGGGDPEVIRKLNGQNERLRNLLKEINDALTQAMAAKRAKQRPAEIARNPASPQELENTYKRIGIYKKANDVLREQIASSFNPDKMIELRNELAAAKIAQRKTMDENTTLRTQIRRMAKEFQNSEREVYEQKVAALTAELAAYKEKLASYVNRHNTEEKAAIKQQEHMSALEQKSRKLQDELAALRGGKQSSVSSPPPIGQDSNSKEAKEALVKRLTEQARTLETQNAAAQNDARAAKKRLGDVTKEVAALRKQIEEKNAELGAAQGLMAQVQKEAKEAGARTRLQGQNLSSLG